MQLLNSQSLPYHSLKKAMQPSLSVCGTVGNNFLRKLADIAELQYWSYSSARSAVTD